MKVLSNGPGATDQSRLAGSGVSDLGREVVSSRDSAHVAAILRSTADVLSSISTGLCDEVRALVRARNAIDAALAMRFADMADSGVHAEEGASTVRSWAQSQVRLDRGQTARYERAARVMAVDAEVAAMFASGDLSLAHVDGLSYGRRRIDPQAWESLRRPLLEIAVADTAGELRRGVRRCVEVVHADELERAWERGQEREFLSVAKVADGWHVRGFLGIETGTKLKSLLDSYGVPRVEGDRRGVNQRAVEGLDAGLEKLLSREPSDGVFEPGLHVRVDAAELAAVLSSNAGRTDGESYGHGGMWPRWYGGGAEMAEAESGSIPSELIGFGPIGRNLLGFLACGGYGRGVLVETVADSSSERVRKRSSISVTRNDRVLDVGRASRFATKRQREAVALLQNDQCGVSACPHPIRDVHHVQPWSHGGRTDLANLIGLCRACHRMAHQGHISIERAANGTSWRIEAARHHRKQVA